MVSGVAVLLVLAIAIVGVTKMSSTPRGTSADRAAASRSGSITTTTISPLLTTTSTAPSPPPVTISALEAAAVTQSGLGAGTKAKCGPAPTGLGVGSYVACGLDSPSAGILEEILQMTGTSPSSFVVVAAPSTNHSCDPFNNAELAAWTAQDQACS
jgi:hypothetical protein